MTDTLLIGGPIGSGKSTILKLLVELAGNPRLVFGIDTKKCLALSRKCGTDCGKKLLALQEKQDKGHLMPGKETVQSMLENFKWINDQFKPVLIAVAGCARSLEEIQEMDRAAEKGLVKRKYLFVECTDTEIEAGIQARIASGEMRSDDGPAEVETRKKEYAEKTLPAVKTIPDKLICRTERSKTLTERLRDAINCIGNTRLRETLLRKLNTRDHPIHRSIYKIEHGGEEMPEPQKMRIEPLNVTPIFHNHVIGEAAMARA